VPPARETFISREVIDACVVSGRHEWPPVPSIAYRAFGDPAGGSGGDSFTLAIAHAEVRNGRRCGVLDAIRERRPPFSPESTTADLAALLRAYGITEVTGDRYAGEWPREQFRKHGVSYTVAAQPKSDLYRDALPSLNAGIDEPRRRRPPPGRGQCVGPAPGRTTFGQLAQIITDDYRMNGRTSLTTMTDSFKALRAFFGSARARDITLDRLNAYVVGRQDAGRQLGTIRNELAVLKRAFHLAERAGRVICPPFPKLTVENAREGFFEEAEYEAVVHALHPARDSVRWR
jgi:hypothetical protein